MSLSQIVFSDIVNNSINNQQMYYIINNPQQNEQQQQQKQNEQNMNNTQQKCNNDKINRQIRQYNKMSNQIYSIQNNDTLISSYMSDLSSKSSETIEDNNIQINEESSSSSSNSSNNIISNNIENSLNLDRTTSIILEQQSEQNKNEDEGQNDDIEPRQLLEQFDHILKNNIGKNIIKAFFGYLLDIHDNDLLSDFVAKGVQVAQARKMANNYFKQYSFNNKSLHKLIHHPKYSKAFEYYLTFEAEVWLANSKVQEKSAHLIYIDFLKLCCTNLEFSNHLVTYKKNKRCKFNDRL